MSNSPCCVVALICETGPDFNHALAKAADRGKAGVMRHLILVLFLAACASTQAPPATPSLPDTCGVGAYTYLIGQPATALERVLIMQEVRIIRPWTMVTMDYRAGRINFKISDQDMIADASCG
jgi:uncharacterized lipoprotein YmbA